MDAYEILQRWTGRPIVLVEAHSIGEAISAVVSNDVSLLYADIKGVCLADRELSRADLRGADLSGSDASRAELGGSDLRSARLRGCKFRGSGLRDADLRHADLRDTDFRHADLRGSRLTGADLRGAVFHGAMLEGACLDWRWSALALELLRQHPASGREGSKAVAELAFASDERPFLWLKTLLSHGLAADWVLGLFAEHIRFGDNAPALLRRLAADAPAPIAVPTPLWAIRRPA
jgi:hypothetical protein